MRLDWALVLLTTPETCSCSKLLVVVKLDFLFAEIRRDRRDQRVHTYFFCLPKRFTRRNSVGSIFLINVLGWVELTELIKMLGALKPRVESVAHQPVDFDIASVAVPWFVVCTTVGRAPHCLLLAQG